jgi:NAD(P)-dependent dehydrogenase (short-subunit alcohol dehydrogenase family)
MNPPVILITGALAGIGRATASAFAREGAQIVVSGRREAAGQTLVAELSSLDTNVLGTLLSMKHELRVMQPQGSGSIINLSSTVGHRGVPGASVYTASKHAVEGLTKSAALEAAPFGVRVNAVAPGPVDTEMLTRFAGSAERKAGLLADVPFKRAGSTAEIADAMVFLASAKAAFITGQIIDVNGGKTAA